MGNNEVHVHCMFLYCFLVGLLPSFFPIILWIFFSYDNALQFFTQDFGYLYDPTNETAGTFVPAQILYDAFHGRYHSATGAIILLFIIWGSFFFGGLSITTSAARVVSSYHFFT